MATNWINDLLGKTVRTVAGDLPDRKFLKFINGTVVDDPATGETVVDLASGGGGGATWAQVLANGFTSGANSPSIDGGQHLNFNEVDIRTTQFGGTVLESLATDDELRTVTGVRLTSSQAGVGIANDLESGSASLGLRADNPTPAAAFQTQRSPAITLKGSGWFTDIAQAFDLIWGWQVRPQGNTNTTALDLGSLTLRRHFTGGGGSDVVRYGTVGALDKYFGILSAASSQLASTGRGLRVGEDFQATALKDAGGDVRWFDFNSGLIDVDDVLLGYEPGSAWGVVSDLAGTPLPRLIIDDEIWVFAASTGTDPIAAGDDEVTLFSGPDGSDWIGVIAVDPAVNPNGENTGLENQAETAAFTAGTENDATAGVQQFSRYFVWNNAQWDTNAAASSPNDWGWQLRSPSHDHTALPDLWGALVLRANHRDFEQHDIMEIRHEIDVNGFRHTYLGPPDGETAHIFNVHGRHNTSGDGMTLELFGGDGSGGGNAGGFILIGGGQAPGGGQEGTVAAIKRHPIAESIVTNGDEAALALINFTPATGAGQQFSPQLGWSGSTWDTFTAAALSASWLSQVRLRENDSSLGIDYGAWVLSADIAGIGVDVLEINAIDLGQHFTALRRQADDSGVVQYGGTDAVSAATDGGPGFVQGGVGQTTGRGGRGAVVGGPSTGAGDQGDAVVDGHNALIQSGAGIGTNGGMVRGIIVDAATTVPTSNPAAGRVYIYLDPADDRMRYRDPGGVFRLW
jgi:hypothetical protein